MAIVEMDETEVLNLRNIAGTVQKMLSNPDARARVLQAQKIINPNAPIPEIDATVPLRNALGEVHKELGDVRKKIEEEKAEREKEKALARLQAGWESGQSVARKAGYTAEGLEALEKFMEEKGIADHELAMPAFERIHPLEQPVNTSGTRFDFFQGVPKDGDDMKMLLEGDDRGFTSKRIKETLAESRSGNRR